MRANPGEQIEPLAARGGVAGVVEVDQGGVDLLPLQQRDDALGHMGGGGAIALGLEQEAKGFDDIGLVIGYQDEGGRQRQDPIP